MPVFVCVFVRVSIIVAAVHRTLMATDGRLNVLLTGATGRVGGVLRTAVRAAPPARPRSRGL